MVQVIAISHNELGPDPSEFLVLHIMRFAPNPSLANWPDLPALPFVILLQGGQEVPGAKDS